MEDLDLKKDGSEPPGSISPSMRSDRSKDLLEEFSNEPRPSDRKDQNHRGRAEPPGSICPSMSSDLSKDEAPDFSAEPGPSEPERRKRSSVGEEEQPSCCALCQEVLMDLVSTSCGHWFCRQCIGSYREQSAPSGLSSCPQCGERPRTAPELLTANQSSCAP
ncbi:nuclear factor 7, brain-like, partial [Poecilia formosa]|uniref:nuclear factor 7, brain-like n=1 Tax=Poecilia formosa TaxID=48698 RepID=UPI0007B7BE52